MPHSRAQHDFLASKTRITAALAGNRFGKTTVNVVKNLIDTLDVDDVPGHLLQYKKWKPPFHLRFCSVDFERYIDTVVQETIRKWVPRSALMGGSWDNAYSKSNHRLLFKNGSFWEFMSYGQDIDAFGGSARHRIAYDEEPPKNIRTECLARLADFGGDEIYSVTPIHGMTWMYHDVYKQRAMDYITVVNGSIHENPTLDAETVAFLLSQMDEDEREARTHGNFVSFAGRIFKGFTRDEHVIDPPELADIHAVDCYVVIDPGVRNPAAIFAAVNELTESVVLFDEIKPGNVDTSDGTVEMMSRLILEKLASYKIDPKRVLFYIDPAARAREQGNPKSVLIQYVEHGIDAIPANNDFEASISEVRRLFREGKLKISGRCPKTVDELEMYRWADIADASKEDRKARAYKKNDHLVDPIRYLSLAVPWYMPPDECEEEKPNPLEVAVFGAFENEDLLYDPVIGAW